MVSRFGNIEKYHNKSAKLLALLLFTMRGTVYVYQGDEIGMTNVAYPNISYYNDVETLNSYKEALAQGKDMDAFLKLVHMQSRDNARTPMQWNSSKNAGFSDAKPWLEVNSNYKSINVEAQEKNEDSILHFYRKMNAFRKENKVIVYGNYECLNEDDPNLYFYKRYDDLETYIILLNFSNYTQKIDNQKFALNNTTLCLSNYADNSNEFLNPWESQVRKYL